MKPILIIKTGSTLPGLVARKGDFEDWVLRGMGVSPEHVVIIDVETGGELPAPQTLAGAAVTGSHAMVTDRLPWSERTTVWLRHAVASGLPLLGICYGHQLLAHALGGSVGNNPKRREFGTVEVTLNSHAAPADDLFGPGTPTAFPGHVAHSQSVLTLPPGARVLASTPDEPNAVVAFAPYAWGVQFHPEFDTDIIRAYIHEYQTILRGEGQQPEALLRAVRETPVAAKTLKRFAAIARRREARET